MPTNAKRNVSDFMGDRLDVKMFGVDGDGVTDYTAGLQDAIDYAITNGSSLYLPAGTYKHTGLSITAPIAIYGAGKETSILSCTGATSSIKVLGTSPTWIERVLLSDFQILGDPATTTYGLEINRVAVSEFKNLSVVSHGLDGVNIGYSWVLTFQDCDVYQNRRDGYRFSKALHSEPTEDQNAIRIIGGRIVGNYERGIYVKGGISNVCYGTDIEANHSEGVLLEGAWGFALNNCHIELNGRETNSDSVKLTTNGSLPCIGVSILGGFVHGSGNLTPNHTHGVNVDNAYRTVIGDGVSFNNNYHGSIILGASAVATRICGPYYGEEAGVPTVTDNSTTALTVGHGDTNDPLIKAVALLVDSGLVTFNSSSTDQQVLVRATGAHNAQLGIEAPAGKQGNVGFYRTTALKYLLGLQTDDGLFLYDVDNTRNMIEILSTGELVFAPTTGAVLVGTHSNDGVHLFAVNGGFRCYGNTLLDGALTLSTLAGGGTRFLAVDNAGAVGVSVPLLPDQSGHAGQFLKTNATVADWAALAQADIPAMFTDRGDPAAADKIATDLTIDSAYHDWDLSAIVPAGATSVLIRVTANNTGAGATLLLRKNGISNAVNITRIDTQVKGVYVSRDAVVPCDSGRVIEYYVLNSGTWNITLAVGGWWK